MGTKATESFRHAHMVARARNGNTKQDRHFVTALARGLDVLACFRSGSRMLGNQDISTRCKLPKSTVSRLTYTLTKLGYLHYVNSAGKYRLGTATIALGSAVMGRFDVRDIARPLLQDLAQSADASVALGACERLSMVCIEVCKGNGALAINMDVGMRLTLATSAIGRAFLATCSDAERSDLMDRLQELDHAAWPKLKDGIDRAMAEYQELGVCTSFGDWRPEVNGIALGFRPGNGLPPMSINCGAPAFKASPEFLLNEVRPQLIELVRKLEENLAQPAVTRSRKSTEPQTTGGG